MSVSGRCKSLQNPRSITEEISRCSAQTRKPAISWRSWKKWRLSPDVPCGERLLQRSNDRRKPPAGKQWFIDVTKTKRPHGLKEVRIRIACWNFDGFSTGLVFCLKQCFSDGAESFPSWQSWGATKYSWSYMWLYPASSKCLDIPNRYMVRSKGHLGYYKSKRNKEALRRSWLYQRGLRYVSICYCLECTMISYGPWVNQIPNWKRLNTQKKP